MDDDKLSALDDLPEHVLRGLDRLWAAIVAEEKSAHIGWPPADGAACDAHEWGRAVGGRDCLSSPI
jgi:hypothetical protein